MNTAETLSVESKLKLQAAVPIIHQAVKIGNSALRKFPEAHYDIQTFTFINYLERFKDVLDAVAILLQNFNDKPNLETSIGLTLRAGLLDFMVVTFLTSYYTDISPENPKGQKEFDSVIITLNSDQLHNTLKYIEVMRKNRFITKEESDLAITNLHTNYSFLFDSLDLNNPISSLKVKKFYSSQRHFSSHQ